MKVLILGVSTAQLDAVVELNKIGCETFTVAMAKDGPAADMSDHFDIINVLDEEAIEKHILKNRIDVVYSTGTDIAMPVACKISERLGLPHFVSSEAAYICNHKNELRSALSSDYEGNVPYQVMSDIEKINLAFPLMLKPSDAQGQRGIFLIHSQDEFEQHFSEAKSYSRQGKVIVEQYIDGLEISVNVYMVDGVMRFFVASDRDTWSEYTGLIHRHIVPGKTFNEETERKIRCLAEDSCRRMGIQNGPVYFQMKVMESKPYLIEMTPRLDGCHMWNVLERSTGVNLMRLTFQHLLSNDISELDKWTGKVKPMELVFWCKEPKTYMKQSEFELPEDAVHHCFYYEDGKYIRPVNGRFEKVGYYIRNL